MIKVWLNYYEVHLYVTTSKSRGEGQGNTHTEFGTDIQTELTGQTGRPTGIDTTHTV